jgi:hypothetical protein
LVGGFAAGSSLGHRRLVRRGVTRRVTWKRAGLTAAGNDIVVGGVPLRFASASPGSSATAGPRIDALRITDGRQHPIGAPSIECNTRI